MLRASKGRRSSFAFQSVELEPVEAVRPEDRYPDSCGPQKDLVREDDKAAGKSRWSNGKAHQSTRIHHSQCYHFGWDSKFQPKKKGVPKIRAPQSTQVSPSHPIETHGDLGVPHGTTILKDTCWNAMVFQVWQSARGDPRVAVCPDGLLQSADAAAAGLPGGNFRHG